MQERLFAWSGSDSDDGMGLVGIAVDGAISGEVTEEEEEERPRCAEAGFGRSRL